MITQLRIVNDCLAIMGEAPLNSLAEDHTYKAAALGKLATVSERIQAKGWWFNKESLALATNLADNRIYLPSDVTGTITFDKRPTLTQRGRVVYDLENGTDIFPAGTTLKAQIIRLLTIDLIPTLAAEYIAGQTLLEFQNLYDGDQTKTRNLMITVQELKAECMAEHVRNRKVNLIDRSVGLSRIRMTHSAITPY